MVGALDASCPGSRLAFLDIFLDLLIPEQLFSPSIFVSSHYMMSIHIASHHALFRSEELSYDKDDAKVHRDAVLGEENIDAKDRAKSRYLKELIGYRC